MIGSRSDTSPDVQKLAQTVLAMVQPFVEAGKAYAAAAEDGPPGRCAQVWCPVCAAAAVASGEHHPMTSVVAEYAAALLSILGAVAQPEKPPPPPSADCNGQSSAEPSTPVPGRYHAIAVTIHE